jgi:hypothetical protein
MFKIDSFQYKSQFHYVFNVNPGNQGSRYFFAQHFEQDHHSLQMADHFTLHREHLFTQL